MSIHVQLQAAKQASRQLAACSSQQKNKALRQIIALLHRRQKEILQRNQEDLRKARQQHLADPLLHRLALDENKIAELSRGLKNLIALENPVGKTLMVTELDKGLLLRKVTCPLGVIGVIFESRPDAFVQISSLCLKSGNVVILKGGSEAALTNKILYEVIIQATKKILPPGWIQLLTTREEVKELLQADGYVDLLIPRGSSALVRYIQDHTKIPVLGHSEGICHIYVDKDANLAMTKKIILDAKVQYPAVCNAVETILLHHDIPAASITKIITLLQQNNVEVRVENPSSYPGTKKVQSWSTEYSGLIVAIKVVPSLPAAVQHINTYGSHHTDTIITSKKRAAQEFFQAVDSTCVFWNCSTRFSDGYRFGFGAEVGVSTGKLHARGPVGLEGLGTYKYLVEGNGQTVGEYTQPGKKFTHRKVI